MNLNLIDMETTLGIAKVMERLGLKIYKPNRDGVNAWGELNLEYTMIRFRSIIDR